MASTRRLDDPPGQGAKLEMRHRTCAPHLLQFRTSIAYINPPQRESMAITLNQVLILTLKDAVQEPLIVEKLAPRLTPTNHAPLGYILLLHWISGEA